MYWSVAGIACLLVVLGGLLGSASLAAEPVYRWLDADGVTHFSQRPPPPGAAGVTVQEAPTYQAAPDPDADYWSVTNQVQRMEASGLAREQLRLEQQRARRELEEAERQRIEAEQAAAAPEPPRQLIYYPVPRPPFAAYSYGYPRYTPGWPPRQGFERRDERPEAHRDPVHGGRVGPFRDDGDRGRGGRRR